MTLAVQQGVCTHLIPLYYSGRRAGPDAHSRSSIVPRTKRSAAGPCTLSAAATRQAARVNPRRPCFAPRHARFMGRLGRICHRIQRQVSTAARARLPPQARAPPQQLHTRGVCCVPPCRRSCRGGSNMQSELPGRRRTQRRRRGQRIEADRSLQSKGCCTGPR